MKIAFANDIVYQYATRDPVAVGGAERLQWMLARALVQAGWSVTVGVRRYLAPQQTSVISGVRFVGIQPAYRGRAFLRAWSRFLDDERPNWYYWQGADPLFGPLLLVARMKAVRGIFSAAFDRDVQPRVALTRRQHLWPIYAWGLSAVERIFVQHGGQLSELSRTLQAKTSVMPGVVGLRDHCKTRSERGNYVVWVAVMRQPKRPDLLIEIARKSPDVRYLVCGGISTHRTPAGYGERMAAELQTLPNVEYMGHVAPDRALDAIGNATALLSTSDQEGFPSTFLEAWSAGTPVVSISVDPDGIIARRGLGCVSGDTDGAVSDLRRLLTSSEAFEPMSNRARQYIEREHSEAAVAHAFNTAVGLESIACA